MASLRQVLFAVDLLALEPQYQLPTFLDHNLDKLDITQHVGLRQFNSRALIRWRWDTVRDPKLPKSCLAWALPQTVKWADRVQARPSSEII
ncbi:hypothetical protein [Polaromonas sp.]|uniref:hypothetical protein n=1 Tax=Polaromonas sp. TaxID=1869339 RepID=UPI0025E94F6F|nr:hypothetical protein [Polaromonas sp.]